MRQLLRRFLRAGQSAHIEDGVNLLDASLTRTLDAVVAGDDSDLVTVLREIGQALKLTALCDVGRELVLHLVLHNSGVYVLLDDHIERNLDDQQPGTHVMDYLVAFRFACHSFSLLSHSVSVAFSDRPSMIGAS